MKELYTHKPYSCKYISEWIDKRKDTRFTKVIKRKYYIDYGFYYQCFIKSERYYYIRPYVRYIFDKYTERNIEVQTYKLIRIKDEETYDYYKNYPSQKEIDITPVFESY